MGKLPYAKQIIAIIGLFGAVACCGDEPMVEVLPPEPVTTIKYESRTTITPNPIEENKSGKIATVKTDVYKVNLLDGKETSRETVPNATVTYTDLEKRQTMVDNEIHLQPGYEADYENPDGSDKTNPNIVSYVKALANVNGKMVEGTKTANSRILDTDDFEPFDAGLLIELNEKIPTEYTDAIANPNDLTTNWNESTAIDLIDKVVEGAGTRFERTTNVSPSGNTISYITIDGKRLAQRSFSQMLDGIYRSLLSDQKAAMPNTTDRVDWLINSDMTEYLAKGLNQLSVAEYTGTAVDSDFDAGAEDNVARNIAIGAYK